METKVLDIKGKEKGTCALPDSLFAVKANPTFLHEVITAFLANQRRGTADVKPAAKCPEPAKTVETERHRPRSPGQFARCAVPPRRYRFWAYPAFLSSGFAGRQTQNRFGYGSFHQTGRRQLGSFGLFDLQRTQNQSLCRCNGNISRRPQTVGA